MEGAFSAGTEYFECRVCFSGSSCTCTTPTLKTLPHPVWSTNREVAIIQLGMVQLGGMHGLNS